MVLNVWHFEQGLVDSDTLPLNVSREMLQQHSSLKTIKKKLIRKALDMIRKIADEDPDESNDKDKKGIVNTTVLLLTCQKIWFSQKQFVGEI